MSDLVLKNEGSVEVVSVVSNIIKITIKCKKIKLEKNSFNSVKALMYLPVYDNDGNYLGKYNRWIDMHFTKDAFKTAPEGISSVDDLSTGTLYVEASSIQAPNVYRVKEDENTGELSYPTIWIKGGIKQFEKYVVSQDAFNHHETNQKLIDAVDTDKVTIE